ncbi:MAG TPA: glycosyltransferase, partial [Candidatus Eisenbacteria bacterium]|nr:glycosyltransferase [Candidatus Eisenbacteria bacterium]
MDLSVIVPCRNAERTIGAQLEALCRQAWPGLWEVVVADNGSNDRSRAIVERFARRLPALRCVDASGRLGAARARNVGAKAARGEALIFCDADDEAGAGWLAAMAQALRAADFVANRIDLEKLNPAAVARNLKHVQGRGLQRVAYPPYLPHAGGSGLGIKRAIHFAVGGFDETLPYLEDTDYCFRVQLAGWPLEFVPEAVMHVRLAPHAKALFHQARMWAQYNVLMSKRYGSGARLPRA